MEDSQKLAEGKKLRRDNSMRAREEQLEQRRASMEEANSVLGIWNTILDVITGAERPEKPNDETWMDYFQRIVGMEIPFDHVPPVFQQEDAFEGLSFQKSIIRISSHISMWETKKKKIAAALHREELSMKRASEYHQKVLEGKRRKVEAAFEQEEPEQIEKVEKFKCLD